MIFSNDFIITLCRSLMCNPELSLHVVKGTQHLSYTTSIWKTVQRRQSNQSESNNDSIGLRVEIEKLHPPILRPKKRACILGKYPSIDFISFYTLLNFD